MSLVLLQPDAPVDPHALPHEVPVRPLQALALPSVREAKDGPPAAGVHAGCPPHALWVSTELSFRDDSRILTPDTVSLHLS